jgi:cell division protein ZapE
MRANVPNSRNREGSALNDLSKLPSTEAAAKVAAPLHDPDPAMTPLERYQADLKRPDFFHDAAQEAAVRHLQRLYDELVAEQNKSGLLGKLFGRKRQEPIKGLYFWGGVGRGKTYLVDTFFDALPFKEKTRTHFHRFMKRVHEEMKTLKGEKNPLTLIGKRFADESRVICFDEFFVSDITDAMILATLLEELFKNGVSLVATSNIVPDGLYKDGLQRARFLPAIELLKKHTEIVNVDSGVDYRLRALEQAELYHWPLSAEVDAHMAQSFASLLHDCEHAEDNVDLMIENRAIHARKVCQDVAWFDFRELCDGPRSQNDYIELGKIYHAVLVSKVEKMDAAKDDMARRFINLVDEFYDRNVKLILSAEVELKDLYSGGRLTFEFQRTLSRLLEMQSHEFLARPHRP